MGRPENVGDFLKVLFSGRFDEPHWGHWATILKLLKLFDRVQVVILEYPDRVHPAKYVQRVFETMQILSDIPTDSLGISVNKTHFGEIDQTEWDAFGCDVYAGGNQDVNDHITAMGIRVYNAERSFEFSARNYKQEAKS